MAIFTKKGKRFGASGKVLYGPVNTNNVFKGFGGACEANNNGDAVVRYDQIADRWLIVMPIFRRDPLRAERPAAGRSGGPAVLSLPGRPNQPGSAAALVPPLPAPAEGPYSMCYAISTGTDPFGPYYRYEFLRPLFPDYPRPAIWRDGYYVPTSTGDEVIQKHTCVMLAAGGTQLKKIVEDDVIFAWRVHVDWSDPSKSALSKPTRIPVAPYHYLCDGQLTNCVPQPGSERRLDAQGDKIMARVVYRNVSGRESVVAVHSVNTAAGGGGVRWYELRIDKNRAMSLFQQGTYAPDNLFRWMASPAIDRFGNIGIGYSFGGGDQYAGQRFAGRLASDPPTSAITSKRKSRPKDLCATCRCSPRSLARPRFQTASW